VQDDIIIAAMIRKLRRGKEVSQAQLAAALNLPQPVVSKIEHAERRVALSELRVVCNLLQIPLSEFIAEYEAEIRKAGSEGPVHPGRRPTDR
jgi:transcriptional regulator with XRE-family HTH domain